MKDRVTPKSVLVWFLFTVAGIWLTPQLHSFIFGSPPIRMGERALDDNLAAVVTTFSCEPPPGEAKEGGLVQGHLCSARVVIENHGTVAVKAKPVSKLQAASGRYLYPALLHRGRAYSLTVFPDGSAKGTIIFDVPFHIRPGFLLLDLNGDGSDVVVELQPLAPDPAAMTVAIPDSS